MMWWRRIAYLVPFLPLALVIVALIIWIRAVAP